MTLSEEQRWLVASVGGWMAADCLIDPERGIPRLMSSMAGASNGRRSCLYPQWLTGGYACGRGRIKSPWIGERSRVTVTGAELRRFAATLDPTIRELLRDARRASTAETLHWIDACRCGTPKCHDGDTNPLTTDRWHPTADQVVEHCRRNKLLDERVQQLVMQACGVCARPAEQLTLFV